MKYEDLKAALTEARATIAQLEKLLVAQDEKFERGDAGCESRTIRAEVKLDLSGGLPFDGNAALTQLLEQSVYDVRDEVMKCAREYILVSRFESLGPVGSPVTTLRAELGIWRDLSRPVPWPVHSSTVLSPLYDQSVNPGLWRREYLGRWPEPSQSQPLVTEDECANWAQSPWRGPYRP